MHSIGHRGSPSFSRYKKLVAELRDQLEQAHETIFRLNQLLQAQSGNLYKGINLTRNQQTILDILLTTSGVCSNETLYAALYVSRKGRKRRPQVVRNTIRLLRKQLKPLGIDIENIFGRGYFVDTQNKAKLRGLILK